MFACTSNTSLSSSNECSLHQPTGSFCYESCLMSGRFSSTPHHPLAALASHSLRVAFGEQVQWVADGLYAAGAHHSSEATAITFSSLQTLLKRKQEMVRTYFGGIGGGGGGGIFGQHPSSQQRGQRQGSSEQAAACLRAALLVLIQHSIVSVRRKVPAKSAAAPPPCTYRYHPERAARLSGCRYARFVDYVKRMLQDPNAALVVETLLLHGRLRTIDLVIHSVQQQQQQQQSDGPEATTTATQHHHKYTARETIVDALAKLVRGGFLEQAPQIPLPQEFMKIDLDEGEFEFQDNDNNNADHHHRKPVASQNNQEPPLKKVKLEVPDNGVAHDNDTKDSTMDEDPAVVNLLKSNAQYKSTLPVDAVWRVNQNMFHDSLRAFVLGRLVAQLFSHKVPLSGSLVTAALKYRAHMEHSNGGGGGAGTAAKPSDIDFFTPNDVIKYLPKSVMQTAEEKASKSGRTAANIIFEAFVDLSEIRHPTVVVRRVGDETFEIAHGSLLEYQRRRIIHQVVEDRHGTVAARIVSILNQQGWLESEMLANIAMVPAKDTRVILHELYRSRYIDLFQMGGGGATGKSYNPGSAVYLWCVHPERLKEKIINDVLTATRNLNVRRQHESEVVGREWIERAQRQAQEDENEHETDKLNYQKFCLGLERIDVALQQLDETLLALSDF